MTVTYTEEAIADIVEAITYLNERNPGQSVCTVIGSELIAWGRTSLLTNSTLLEAGTRTSAGDTPVGVIVMVAAAASDGAAGLDPQRQQ